MALDELKKGDRTYETNGIKIIVDKKADKEIKGISVDVIDTILGKLVVVENLYKVNSGCC